MPELVFFLSPTGELMAQQRPGRCAGYWQLWRNQENARADLRESTDKHRRPALLKRCSAAAAAIDEHWNDCPICRAWLDACECNSLAQTVYADPIGV